jgi:plastocyanin
MSNPIKRAMGIALVLVGAGCPAYAESGGVAGIVSSDAAPGTPVANAVAMIMGPSVPAVPGAPHAVMDQRHSAFVPRVLAVPVGTTVDFPNHDPRLHNVFSTSPTKTFDLGMKDQGETVSVTFDAAGVVEVRCNVHAKMAGVIVVHTNPYVAVSDAGGAYTIRDVPPGSYQLRVWDERHAERTVPVEVSDGAVSALDVALSAEP